jgi:hypothetical protein
MHLHLVSRKGGTPMITEEELDAYRVEGVKIRIVRDADPMNDVRGIIVAWDDESVMVRRPNRKIVKLSREYAIQRADQPRSDIF